jgi:O-antigen ligase
MNRYPFLVCAFLILMLDSLINYFLGTFVARVPINLLVPLLLACSFLQRGPSHLLPPPSIMMTLAAFFTVCSIAILTAYGTTPHRLLELGSAATAFITGFALFRQTNDERAVARLFMLVALLYVVTCTVALLKIAPSLFPVKSGIWSLHGTLIERPEVTTDQNFQIFYLMPIVPLLALPFRPLRFAIVIAGFVGAAFVLAQLQTRSGMLVLISLAAFALLMPIRMKSLGRRKLLPLAMVSGIALLISVPLLYRFGGVLIERFTNTDYSTGLGRLHSFLYLFEKLLDPNYWIPRGNQEFLLRTGNVPHNNVTAFFLEGGLIGLVCWFLLMLVPLIKLWRTFWRRRLHHVGCMVLVMGIGMFVVQMSLNVPFVDQIWLWSGSAVGALSYQSFHRKQQRTLVSAAREAAA